MSNMRRLVLQLLADDSQYNRALDKAPQTAKQAGQKSGAGFTQGFDGGLKVGADGKLRDSLGRFVKDSGDAGQRSGKSFADGFASKAKSALSDGIGNIAQGIGAGIGFSLTNAVMGAVRQAGAYLTDNSNVQGLNSAQVKAGTLTKDTKALTEESKKLSRELGFMASTTEIVGASYDVLSSGFSETKDVIDILRPSLKGAVAGFSDVATVSDAATSILNSYKLKASETTDIINQMLGTQNAGKIVVGEYAQQIGKLASTSSSAGVPLLQLNAAIATATVAGVPVESTFSGIRQAISSILKPSAEATTYAKSLGIEFNATALKSKGLTGILQDVTAKGGGTADGLIKLFGSVEALSAIMPSAGAGLKDYQKNLEIIKNTKVDDTFKDVASSLENLAKKQEVLKQELDIKFKDNLSPIFLGANKLIADFLQALLDSEGGMGELKAVAEGFSKDLEVPPEQMKAFAKEVEAGAIVLLTEAVGVARDITKSLQENPGQIKLMADGLVGAIRNMELLVEATKPFLWLIEKSIEGWTKIGGLVKVIGESMPDENRLRPDVGQRLEFESKKNTPGGQRLQEEVAKYGGSDSDAALIMSQARKSLPFWKGSFSAAEWDKVVREEAKKFFEQNPVKAIAGSSDPNKRVYPIQGGQYVGGGGSFGARRSYGGHDGEDITGSPGTVVKAVMAGTVESIKTLDAAARSFSITAKAIDGTTQYYKHVTPKVAQGQRFESGQAIATVSQQDSLSSGPHLHYGVYRGDQKIDPKSYLKGAIAPNDYRPPAGMTSAKTPGAAATGKSQVTMTDTGKVNAQGQKIFKVDVLDASGNVVFTSAAFSGRPENQKLETAAQGIPGSKNPIPEGRYKLGGYETGDFGKVGDRWMGLKPLSGGARGDEKGPFGFHADVDKILGSEGCIVFTDPATVKRLADKAVQVGAKEFVVNYGLGTVTAPPGKTAAAAGSSSTTAATVATPQAELGSKQKALIAAAKEIGMPPEWLASIISRESGFSPSIRGGAGNRHIGLIQFGEDEQRKYGANQKQSFEEQISGAVVRYFKDRGFKSGMSLAEAYATVLGGNPTAVGKSDGNGSPNRVAKTDFAPGGKDYKAAMAFLGGQKGLTLGGIDQKDLNSQFFAEQDRQRQLLEASRSRQNDQRRQRQEQALKRIDDQKELTLGQFDLESAKLPPESQDSRATIKRLMELKFGRDRQITEIDQATGADGNLRAELKNRIADQKAGIEPKDGRQIGDEIKFLESRKKVIEQTYQVQRQLVAAQSEAKFKEQFDGLAKSAVDAEEQIKVLKRTYADQTPEQRLDNAIASTVAGFDSQKSSIVNNIKSTSELIENKKLLGLETSKEAELLERLKKAYLGMLGVQDQAIAKTKEETDALEKQRALKEQSAIYGMDVAILNGRANARESNGDTFGASALRERADLLQEAIRYTNELAQIEMEYKDRPTIMDKLKRGASELNDLNMSAIADKYKTFGETVGAEIGGAFNGLISDLKNTSNPLELLLNLLNRLADSLLQIGLNALNLPKLLGGLLGGKKGGGGDVLSLIGGLLGGISSSGTSVFGGGDAGLMNLLGFAGGFRDGGRIPNYAGGGSIGLMDAISQAAQREGPGAALIMAHANEHVLSDLTGEAQRYRSLEARFGANPLRLIPNYAIGGMVTGSGLNLSMPNMGNSSALSVSVPVNFSLTTSDPSVNEERINRFTAKMREEVTQIAAGMFMAEFDQRGALR